MLKPLMPSNLVDVGQTWDLAPYISSPDKGLVDMHSFCLLTGLINRSNRQQAVPIAQILN
jgi:hypothetical protein